MYDEIIGSVARPIDLDEVIASAERPERAHQPTRILQMSIAMKLRQIKLFLPTFPSVSSRRYEVRRLIDRLKIYVTFGELDGVHAATYIDADDVWNGFIDDGHGSADGATRSRVDVGHDAHLRPARKLVIAHSTDLFTCLGLDRFCVRYCRCDFALDSFHTNSPSARIVSKAIDCVNKKGISPR